MYSYNADGSYTPSHSHAMSMNRFLSSRADFCFNSSDVKAAGGERWRTWSKLGVYLETSGGHYLEYSNVHACLRRVEEDGVALAMASSNVFSGWSASHCKMHRCEQNFPFRAIDCFRSLPQWIHRTLASLLFSTSSVCKSEQE